MNQVATEKLMTIADLEQLFKVDSRSIRRAIDRHFPGILKNGKKTYLNEIQVTAIKLELDKHHNLGGTAELPKTALEKQLLIQQAMMIQQEMINELLPKVDAFNQFLGTENLHRMDEAARSLRIGKNILYRLLRKNKVFFLQNGCNLPYQEYMDSGYFQVKEMVKRINDKDTSIPVIYCTARGMSFLARFMKRVGVVA